MGTKNNDDFSFVVIAQYTQGYFYQEPTLTPDVPGVIESTCAIAEEATFDTFIKISQKDKQQEDGTVVRTITLNPNQEIDEFLAGGYDTSLFSYGDYTRCYRKRLVECRRLQLNTMREFMEWLKKYDGSFVPGEDYAVLEHQIIFIQLAGAG